MFLEKSIDSISVLNLFQVEAFTPRAQEEPDKWNQQTYMATLI